ncbi:hypothetical protein KL944_003560 [Ogataea haglerorum]|nr:hypothetical protein KL944_003560 [Ogataea haglerorum]
MVSKSCYIRDLVIRICIDIGLHQNASSDTELSLLAPCCSVDASLALHFHFPLAIDSQSIRNDILEKIQQLRPYSVYCLVQSEQLTDSERHAAYLRLHSAARTLEQNVRVSPADPSSKSYSVVLYLELLVLQAEISQQLGDAAARDGCLHKIRDVRAGFRAQIPQTLRHTLDHLET